MERIFRPAEILLPTGNMTAWSVVACDQFSAQPEYWDALDRAVGGQPSALRLIFPEAYLGRRDQAAEAERINAVMREYLDAGVLRALPDSYIYVERTLPSGAVRRGLVGAVDLEAYDYAPGSRSPVRATEGTIAERLPPRVRIRMGAALELPHVMVFLDDPADTVLGGLRRRTAALPRVYDFDLSAGGGHLRGYQVTGDAAEAADLALDALAEPERLRAQYGDAAPVLYAVGDGNHSLATAKRCWEEHVKPGLTPAERETHPARFALAELVNLHDPAVTFEPIHRAVFGTDPAAFLREAREMFADRLTPGGGHVLRLVTAEGEETLRVSGYSIGQLIAAAEDFCQGYAARHGGSVDYIHNDDTALDMGRQPRQAALLLPRMEKGELFPSVARSGPFPKKSFSIGLAAEKRYYLECRKIKRD